MTKLSYADVLSLPTDPWGDYQQLHAGDVQQTGNNAYGSIKQLYLRKKANRKLKTLLSIGGYDASVRGDFINGSKNPASRKRFIDSSIRLMMDWGMDGIDIDWEYPQSKVQADNFYHLINGLRIALDKKAAELGQKYHYLVTAAMPAGPTNYNRINLNMVSQKVDFFNLMAYDYSGVNSAVVAHNANLYHDKGNPTATPFSTDKAVKDYLAKGVPAKKINLGLPLYGRSFAKTDGLGKKFSGTAAANKDGTILFKDLPKKGATVNNRPTPGAMTTYDPKTREMVSLEGAYTAKLKASYVKNNKLGGTFFWEASGDKTGSSSLISTTKTALGSLDDTNNQLAYPSSQFLNIRNGMPAK